MQTSKINFYDKKCITLTNRFCINKAEINELNKKFNLSSVLITDQQDQLAMYFANTL